MDARDEWPEWATEPVEVVEHDPAWLVRGAAETRRLDDVLVAWRTGTVEHVGSTAVPGLPAKPILDLQVPVAELDVAPDVVGVLGGGWHLVPPDLDQRPWRRLLVRVRDERRDCHLILVLDGAERARAQLVFRDALRGDARLAARYAALKRDLAARHRHDREAYTAGKGAFVAEVVRLHDGPGDHPRP